MLVEELVAVGWNLIGIYIKVSKLRNEFAPLLSNLQFDLKLN